MTGRSPRPLALLLALLALASHAQGEPPLLRPCNAPQERPALARRVA
jgi:hypothetical protein